MRNILASLYLSLVTLLGMVVPAYTYTGIAPACCAQVQTNTISIQNECCCCRSVPINQNKPAIEPLTSQNADTNTCAGAKNSSNDFSQTQSVSTFSRVKSAKTKQRKLYILYGSLLM